MSLDEVGSLLYVACRRPPSLLTYDAKSGRIRSSQSLAGDADDIVFDSKDGRLYISCGEGFVEVFRTSPDGNPKRLDRIVTAIGARTSLLVPERGEFVVAAPRTVSTEAHILVYRTTD